MARVNPSPSPKPAASNQRTWVQLCVVIFAPRIAPVAQLDRAPGYEPGGREFESLRARQSIKNLPNINAPTVAKT
jgi:hypothetical protein